MSQSNIFEALQHGLTQAESVQTPGEVHGTLTGMLCMNNEASPARAVEDVETDAADAVEGEERTDATDALEHDGQEDGTTDGD